MNKNLKDFPDFYNSLIERGMILGSVGFNEKEKKNYVLVEYNHNVVMAELRFNDKDNSEINFAIAPIEKNYENKTPTFRVIGKHNLELGSTTLKEVEFSYMGYATAGIYEQFVDSGHVIQGSTTDLISRRSDEEQCKLMQELDECIVDVTKANDFMDRHKHEIVDRIIAEQTYTFEEDPMDVIYNLQDAYEILEPLLESNIGFLREKFERNPDVALYETATLGATLLETIGYSKVQSDIDVTVINGLDYTRGVTPYSAGYVTLFDESDGSIINMISHRGIVDVKNRIFYENNIDGTVSAFKTTADGKKILGELETESEEKIGLFCRNQRVNKEISDKVTNMLLGQDFCDESGAEM